MLARLFLFFSLIFFVREAVAGSVSRIDFGNEEEIVKEESRPKPCYAILPCVSYCDEDTPFFSSASFIFWQGKMGGLDFAAKSNTPIQPNSFTILALNERIYTPDFEWEPGVRLEFGYTFPYDGWETRGRWTYFHGKLTPAKRFFSSATSPLGLGLYPLWYYPFFQNITFIETLLYEKASNYWLMVTNSWDWEWGRNFCINRYLSLRLHAGLKAAYLRQKYNVHYENGSQFAAQINSILRTTLQYLSSDVNTTNRLWGVGPRLGVDSRWKLPFGFHLIADGSFALLPSFFKIRFSIQDLVLDLQDTLANGLLPLTANLKEKFLDFVPVVTARLGGDWGMCVGHCSGLYLGFSICFEMNYWWNVNQTRRGLTTSVPGYLYNYHGDWQTQGLTATVNFLY